MTGLNVEDRKTLLVSLEKKCFILIVKENLQNEVKTENRLLNIKVVFTKFILGILIIKCFFVDGICTSDIYVDNLLSDC